MMQSDVASAGDADATGVRMRSGFQLWARALRLLAIMLTIVIVATPRPLGAGDTTLLFNYVNNSADAQALTYFNGWVTILPLALAYWAHWLPVTVQVSLYVALPLLVCLALQRELHRLLLLRCSDPAATIFSLGILFILVYHVPLAAQMPWSPWFAAIASFLYLLRKNILRDPYSRSGFMLTAIGCLSNPLAIICGPILLVSIRQSRDAPNRALNIALGLLIIGFYLTVYLNSSGAINIGTGFVTAAKAYGQKLIADPNYSNVVPIAAFLVLVALCIAVGRFSEAGTSLRQATYGLAYAGFSSLLLYFASSRFVAFATADGSTLPVPGRYSAVIVDAALLGMILCSSILSSKWRLTVLAIAALGVVGQWLARHHPAGLVERFQASHWLDLKPASPEPFAFAMAADRFRKTCRDGDVIAASASPRAIFVSCSKIAVDQKAVVRRPVLVPGYESSYMLLSDVRVWDTGENTSVVLYVLKPFP
jgi:hypothetical protein